MIILLVSGESAAQYTRPPRRPDDTTKDFAQTLFKKAIRCFPTTIPDYVRN
jgi:hypothetical protein